MSENGPESLTVVNVTTVRSKAKSSHMIVGTLLVAETPFDWLEGSYTGLLSVSALHRQDGCQRNHCL